MIFMEVDLGLIFLGVCFSCLWIQRDQYHILILFLLFFSFLFFFFFWDERDIKGEQKYIYTWFLTEVGYERQTELILGGQSIKF